MCAKVNYRISRDLLESLFLAPSRINNISCCFGLKQREPFESIVGLFVVVPSG